METWEAVVLGIVGVIVVTLLLQILTRVLVLAMGLASLVGGVYAWAVLESPWKWVVSASLVFGGLIYLLMQFVDSEEPEEPAKREAAPKKTKQEKATQTDNPVDKA